MTDIFKAEMAKAGVALNNHLCEHFAYSRQELFEVVKIKEIKTFGELVASHGTGYGCEICKPAVASILASLWNETIKRCKITERADNRPSQHLNHRATPPLY